jgi:hypothetical protein
MIENQTQFSPDGQIAVETFGPLDVASILSERGARYGKFSDHALITQELKRVMFDHRSRDALDSDMVEALEMIAHKIGRILNGDPSYADSWIDIAGYAKLVADRLQGCER